MNEKFGDTEYFASTDYNQRLEEKAESFFQEKLELRNEDKNLDNTTLLEAIQKYDLNTLTKLASSNLQENEFIELMNIGDKDIYIQLAKNPNITDKVADRLIGTVYLAHKELMQNLNIGDDIKNKLLKYMRERSSSIYKDILERYDSINN